MRTYYQTRYEVAAVSLGALLCGAIIFGSGQDGSLLTVFAGFLLSLFLCGYPLAVIFMRWCKEPQILPLIILAVFFSVMVSIGSVVLIHYSSFVITAVSVTISLVIITIFTSCIVVLVSRNQNE